MALEQIGIFSTVFGIVPYRNSDMCRRRRSDQIYAGSVDRRQELSVGHRMIWKLFKEGARSFI